MKFPYKKLILPQPSSVFGRTVIKPIIPVEIIFGEKSLRYEALIDSGADFCIFDALIGEWLGIPIKSGAKEKFGGIHGNLASAYFHEVALVIGGWNYRIQAGFSYEITKYGYGILGQKGFFNFFVVKFDYKKGIIEALPKFPS